MLRLNAEEGITATQWSHISELRDSAIKTCSNSPTGQPPDRDSNTIDPDTDDPVTQAEQEERIIDWIESHGVNDGWKLASDLINAGITIENLNDISKTTASARSLQTGTDVHNSRVEKNLKDILSWLTTTTRVDHLLEEIKSSTTRISDLVSAVKSYSYIDQAPLQDVDIHKGIESILTMLHYKLRKADITINREYDSNLSHVNAYGNGLSEVWTNLIDNAIDAIGEHGAISIGTKMRVMIIYL